MTDDDGLTLSSAAVDTRDGQGTINAKRTFHNYVALHVETETPRHLKLALNNNKLGSTVGAQTVTNVLIVFGVKQSAEPIAQPHIHIAPLGEWRLKTLVLGVMDARREADGGPTRNLLPGDLYLMPDNGEASRASTAPCSWTRTP